MQTNLNRIPTIDDYLHIIRNFMLQIHKQINEPANEVTQRDITIIDKAVVKLKMYKEEIELLEKSVKQCQCGSLRKEKGEIERKYKQKMDEISILRDTIKTLYADNQKLTAEKQQLLQELTAFKESNSSLKKKYKRTEDQISKHKIELQKVTAIAQQRLNNYMKEDREKQIYIKKLSTENERMKSQLIKREKSISQLSKKTEKLMLLQKENGILEGALNEAKSGEKAYLKQARQQKQKMIEKNENYASQVTGLKREKQQCIHQLKKQEKQLKELQNQMQKANLKVEGYERQLMAGTQKLREKSAKIKEYRAQIGSLGERIQELSQISNEIINENKEMGDKCRGLEERLEELRNIQQCVLRMKGDLNNQKSVQLNKLVSSISRIHNWA